MGKPNKSPLHLAQEKIRNKCEYLRNPDLGEKIIAAVEKEGYSYRDAAKELVQIYELTNSKGKPFSRHDTRRWYKFHKKRLEAMESDSNPTST